MEDFHLQNNFLQYRGHKMSGECTYRYADLLRSFPAPSAWRCSQCVNFPAWSFPTHLRLSVINPSITTIIIIKYKIQNNYYNPISQSLGTSWSTVCSLYDSGVNLWGANHSLMPRMPLFLITTNCVSCSVLASYVSEIPHCRTSSFVTVLSQEASASWISRNAGNPKKVYAGAVWGDGPKSFFNFALTKNNLRPRNSNSTQRGHLHALSPFIEFWSQALPDFSLALYYCLGSTEGKGHSPAQGGELDQLSPRDLAGGQ